MGQPEVTWHPAGSGCTEPGPESEFFLFHCTGSFLHLLSTPTGSTYARLSSEDSTHVFVYLFWRSSLIYFLCFPLSEGPMHTRQMSAGSLLCVFLPTLVTEGLDLEKEKWLLTTAYILLSCLLTFPWPVSPGGLAHPPQIFPASSKVWTRPQWAPWVPAYHTGNRDWRRGVGSPEEEGPPF